MIEVFKLINQLKEIQKQKLIVDFEDEKIIYRYYLVSNKCKKISYRKFRNMVINNRIENLLSTEQSVIDVLKRM